MSQFSQFINSLSPQSKSPLESQLASINGNNTTTTTTPTPTTQNTATELTFEKIRSELQSKYNLKVKWYKDLFIITYPKRKGSNDTQVEYTDPLVKECRGLIVNRNAPFNVVCKGFDMLEPEDKIPEDILSREDGKVTATIDGSYVRVYHNPETDTWCVATNRCIEAKKARWHSYRTFFDYFQDASKSSESFLDYSKLDKNRVYLFVVCHPENRIVRAYTKPMMYHIGTLDRSDNWREVEDDIGIPRPGVVDRNFFESLQAMKDHVNRLDWQTPGYVAQWRDENGVTKRSKIRNAEYERINELRGDNRSSVEHYLDLRSDTTHPERFTEFVKYFPEYSVIEDSINMVARYVHQLYLSYYVNKTIQYVPDKICWRLVSELHTRFIRTKEKTTLDIVQQYIRSMPNEELAKLLRF